LKKNIVIIICVCFAALFNAQTDTCFSSLQGKVIDEHDGTALEFAAVFITELNYGVTTDANGNYLIKNLCEGEYHVKISHLGCNPFIKLIKIQGQTIQNFYPEHHSEMLKDVDVLSKKTEQTPTQTKNEISIEKLEQSKGQSLGEALKNITGVTSLNTGNSVSKPVIHGMHSNRILILNNGVRQEGQQWGIEHAPEIDPFIANKISVVKGANSVRYGSDAIAGVVLIDTKPLPDTAGITGEINLVGMSNGKAGTASAFIEGNFDKLKALSWRVQGTLKQSGTIHAPKYNLVNTAFKEYNFSYAIGWKKQNVGADIFYSQFNTTLGIFGASHIGNLSDLQTAFTSSVPLLTGPFTYSIGRPFQHIEHELLKINSYVKTGNVGQLKFVYSRQYNLRYEYDKHRPRNDSLAALNKPELSFEITSHTADLIWEHKPINHIVGSIGLNGITQGNTYEGRMLIPNFQNYSGGAFWIERWRKNRLEIEGGVRYDYKFIQVFKYNNNGTSSNELQKPIHVFKNTSGNLGAIFKKDSSLHFALNLGTAWRAPSVNELYTNGLHHGAAAIEYGNDSLKLEKAYTAIFTTHYSKSKKLIIEISPYFNYIHNFIFRQPTNAPILTIHGAFPGFNYKQADVTITGCDFYLNYKLIRSLEISSKASILRAWNMNANNWLIMMPSDRYETELTYRFKNLTMIKTSYVSASVLYVTKQWRVPANSDFVNPPNAYYTINLHASAQVKVKNQNLEIGLSVMNLMNQSYRDYLDRFRYLTDAIGRNFVVRLKIPFALKPNKNF